MAIGVVLAVLALALAVVALARVAVALDAVELNLRSAVTTVRALHRTLREAGDQARAVARDAAAGEVTLSRLEALKSRGGKGSPPVA
jgi:hypothetical protein